ncbi:MAG: hypothetical protein H7339_07715 [Arcicella sp.]|nr:hypothetical protein [Arcicella sp.]
MKKSKKSWFRGFVVAGVFAFSVLNLSVDFQRDADGGIDITTLSVTSQKAQAVWYDYLIGAMACPGAGTPCSGAYGGNTQIQL